ncbi:RING zinc finger protein, putative [Plasmodium malariae]|uniref:RING-type E3 ubiquitin transferase n=1 Tax=Plasmodium malariae TaxID=5858 RepID=A0A1C3KZW7_PLAMA|nr:RING zinc finger protein, putative [Plasmodium malariae]
MVQQNVFIAFVSKELCTCAYACGVCNYFQLNNTETVIFRYFTMMLYLLLILCILSLIVMSIYYFHVTCEECDYYNRVLVIGILIKNIGHINLTIIRVKRRSEIEENERLRSIMVALVQIFNSLTFVLALLSLYLLHFYKNVCSSNTLSLKLIRIYYYFTITLYFIPLLFYISLGLFLSIIICIMINFSVDENDRIPTPENIINKLQVVKYKDIEYIYKKTKKNKRSKKYIKKPSFEMIFDKVKSVIRHKGNKQKEKEKEKKIYIHVNSKDSNNIGDDDNLQEMLKPLNVDMQNEKGAYSASDYNRRRTQEYLNGGSSSNGNNSGNNASTSSFNSRGNTINAEIPSENEDVCSICMMNYISNDNIMIMPCDKRHFFHVNCLTKWLYKSQVCPICRTNIVNCVNSKNDLV